MIAGILLSTVLSSLINITYLSRYIHIFIFSTQLHYIPLPIPNKFNLQPMAKHQECFQFTRQDCKDHSCAFSIMYIIQNKCVQIERLSQQLCFLDTVQTLLDTFFFVLLNIAKTNFQNVTLICTPNNSLHIRMFTNMVSKHIFANHISE